MVDESAAEALKRVLGLTDETILTAPLQTLPVAKWLGERFLAVHTQVRFLPGKTEEVLWVGFGNVVRRGRIWV